MGREAIGIAIWQGETAEVKALLESTEIILRGAIRARLPRASMEEIAATNGVLTLRAAGAPLELDLGEKEAEKWAAGLLRPAPSLASKLGIGHARPAHVIGAVTDEALADALHGHTADAAEAAVLIAELHETADLDRAPTAARARPELPLWCVYPKGRGPVDDATVRAVMRDAGYIDSKSCAVSATMTATRYGPRRD